MDGARLCEWAEIVIASLSSVVSFLDLDMMVRRRKSTLRQYQKVIGLGDDSTSKY